MVWSFLVYSTSHNAAVAITFLSLSLFCLHLWTKAEWFQI